MARQIRSSRRMDIAYVRAEYIACDVTIKQLADKYGVSYETIKDRSKREGWGELRKEAKERLKKASVDAYVETIKPMLEENLKRAALIAERASVLKLRLLEKTLEAIENADFKEGSEIRTLTDEGYIRSIKRLRDLTNAVKELDTLDVYMKYAMAQKDREDKEKPALEPVIIKWGD